MKTYADTGDYERDVLEALDKICASEYFSEAEQIRKFLRYVVGEALDGRADRIKSYSVAVEALGKSADFDPTQDPIVRITANRLRSALAKYYNEAREQHTIVIRLPKGHYVPEFDIHDPKEDTAPSLPDHEPMPGVPTQAQYTMALRWRWIAAAVAILGIFAFTVVLWSRFSIVGAEDSELGKVWIVVQELEMGPADDTGLARVLGDQLIAQMTRYDGVNIVDAGRSPVTQSLAEGLVPDSAWTGEDIFSVSTFVQIEEGAASVRWYLTDMHTHQVMWASDRKITFGSGDGATAIVHAIAAEMLGLEGAIPIILDRAQDADAQSDAACMARAQRNAFTDDIMLLDQFAVCLERVVRNHPYNGQAWALLSLAYHRQGRFAVSLGRDATELRRMQQEAAQKAAMISPETFFPHLAQLAAVYDAGQYAALENLADRMLRRYSGDPRLKVTVGKAFVSMGRPERGLPLIEAGLEQIPSLGALGYTMLALERYIAGDLDSALNYLDVQALPDDYRYWLMKTIVHSRAGQVEAARQAWNALIALKPDYGASVCAELKSSDIHRSYYDQIVGDLRNVVDDLPEDSCGRPPDPAEPSST